LILAVASLPFKIFYIFSDIISYLLYFFSYRKKVIRKNLKLVFPKMTKKEIALLEKNNYKHMTDIFLEMAKSLLISKKDMMHRFKFNNIKALTPFEKKDQNIIIMCAHYASWEWMLSLGYHVKNYKGYGVYTPVTNKYFDRLVKKIRKKHNAEVISRYKAINTIKEHSKKKHKAIYGFASDQSPRIKPNSFYLKFLGINTPVFLGAEKLAKELDLAVVFAEITRVKRGYYETTFKVVSANPKETEDYQITKTFFNLVEKQIYKDPSQYLWSHNRFKNIDPMIRPKWNYPSQDN
jgi:Kdo2-lipid IVA lauroyltransferase/acyltransferase